MPPASRIAPPRTEPGRPPAADYLARAQLSIVEHALCPLDGITDSGQPHVYRTGYAYTDQHRHRRKANVRVTCPEGLSPTDEFYLWGLLSLTFSQPHPSLNFYATPYYCMRRLCCIDQGTNRGGKNFQLFRDAITRLAAVTYHNDRFYDPLRGEHREVSFGFFSYSLPFDPDSPRPWRFAWDPIFFEFCEAARSTLRFDFGTYRSLDPASRRLYLLLKKIFWRRDVSPSFELHQLAVDVLGFAPSHDSYELRRKVARCICVLAERGIIDLPPQGRSLSTLFYKRAKGDYRLSLRKGPGFDNRLHSTSQSQISDSPLYDPLTTIGIDDKTIPWIIRTYDSRLVADCADMTLAAKERFGPSFFKASPQAYFIDNLKHFAARDRTQPDWWRQFKRQEELRRQDATAKATPDAALDRDFDSYLETQARDAFERVMKRVFEDLRAAGQSDPDAREHAERAARTHFLHRFRAERSSQQSSDNSHPDGWHRLSELLNR